MQLILRAMKPDNDPGPIEPERLDTILRRRAAVWPPARRMKNRWGSVEGVEEGRDAWAAPMWERYRQQALAGGVLDLEAFREGLLAKREKDEENRLKLRDWYEGHSWGILLLQRLHELHGDTTGEDLIRIYPHGRHEALGEEWVVTPTWKGVLVGEDEGPDLEAPLGMYFYLSPRGDVEYAGDTSKAHFEIAAGQTIREAYNARVEEYRELVDAEREILFRIGERERHAALIGVLLEELELEGEVLPWFIGRDGEPAEPSPHRGLSAEDRAELLTSAPAFHEYVRRLRTTFDLTLEAAYLRAVEEIGGTRWPSGYESFKTAHGRHWRMERKRRHG